MLRELRTVTDMHRRCSGSSVISQHWTDALSQYRARGLRSPTKSRSLRERACRATTTFPRATCTSSTASFCLRQWRLGPRRVSVRAAELVVTVLTSNRACRHLWRELFTSRRAVADDDRRRRHFTYALALTDRLVAGSVFVHLRVSDYISGLLARTAQLAVLLVITWVHSEEPDRRGRGVRSV